MNKLHAMREYGNLASEAFEHLDKLGVINISKNINGEIEIHTNAQSFAKLDVVYEMKAMKHQKGFYRVTARFHSFLLIAILNEKEKQKLFPEMEGVTQ
ncbi:hypothetical protein EPH95_02875 [Salicibibacter halophilus]|uniref:Uncharacterized protein n=1 Tax=Salicibibacter halophilus TaxID=2502791 RepID=A0A514LFB0_9BACI|nr:hypothetical protein [Salicibibacter halophilus]QDI90245.1 hypothetical protein EPH95_02875 [Salicibibacter halophilus]